MSRIRTIKPDAFRSDSLSTVPREMRWTFAGLWTYADDAGRGRDDVRLIKAELYPLDDAVSLAVLSADLERLAGIGSVCRYEAVDGRRYFHMPAWLDHQRINRPSPSKLPPCPSHDRPMSAQPPKDESSLSDHGGISEDSQEERKGGEGNGTEQGGEGKSPKRGHQLPDDWKPNDQHTQKALQLELDLASEVDHFRDHATANGVTRKDWDAAFRMWLRNSAKWGKSSRNPNRSTGPDWDAAMTRADGRADHLEIA